MSDEQIAKTCLARDVCSQHRRLCASTCVGYGELEYQLRLSAIPKRFQSIGGSPASSRAVADLINAENPHVTALVAGWGGDVYENVSEGRSLYLYGRTTGTGKTTVATALALDYIRAAVSAAMADGRGVSHQLAYYVNVPTFLRQSKVIYESDDVAAAQASAEVAAITAKMTKVPLLVLDDIGAEKPSEAVRERLLAIIDQRWANRLSTIYTSNLTLAELEVTLTNRVRSRVSDALPVQFGGTDHRRKG